ncbi:MAG: hypothetical protein O7A04_12700 [Acidobacteria bacterium]|nr:hypothetical protein [Acidobacteriota bacterium]
MLLVNSDEYKDKTFTIFDSCAHCSDRIEVKIDSAQIAYLNPDSVYVQQGGG